MKKEVCAIAGIVGGVIVSLLGGWDASTKMLLFFMAIDYLTGMLVAGVFKKSEKTESGGLESRAGWKGLCRKGTSLLVVCVAQKLDEMTGANYVRDMTVMSYIANEGLSITENVAIMGVPLPMPVKKALEVLNKKEKEEQNGELWID